MYINIGRRKDRKIYGREVLIILIYYEIIKSKKKEKEELRLMKIKRKLLI